MAVIIMIIMYNTCDSNISGNELYGDAGWYSPRGLTNERNYVFICDFLGPLKGRNSSEKNLPFKH